MVIFFISGSCRFETSSGLTHLEGVETGSNMPVACCVSERRAGGDATSHQCAANNGGIVFVEEFGASGRGVCPDNQSYPQLCCGGVRAPRPTFDY